MAQILRGEIRWADLDPIVGHEQSGRRPVLILAGALFAEKSHTVIAVAITSREPKPGFPVSVPIHGLPKPSWAIVPQVRLLSVHRLGETLAVAAQSELSEVVRGLNLLITKD